MHTKLFGMFLLLALVGVVGITTHADASEKSTLRVLYVGHDPAKPRMVFADRGDPRQLELYQERTAAFTELLRERFAHVTVVHGNDYRVGMSDDVDVTIFDARPKALTPTKRETDPETGKVISYQAATYLPADFDRAALTIAENSPLIGEPLGLKHDWL